MCQSHVRSYWCASKQMATPGSSPAKLVEDSDTAAFSPQPSGSQQALELEDVIEFVEPLANELKCPLCLEFLKEPAITSCCGHHFCHGCIDRVITRNHVCPLCNNQGFQTFLNKEKQRLVNTLKVYCKWKSRGCEWVGELGRLDHHLDVEEGDCGCVEVECEFGPVGCVAKLPRKNLQRHKEENVHKHLVLMSVMSLKSNEAFVKKLREQRVEFQQQRFEFQKQLKQKDEEIQAVRESLQHQLQQRDQQIADIQDQLLQKGEQITTVQQNMEAIITDLERQLKGELVEIEEELTENVKLFVEMQGRLHDKDQQLATFERRLDDVDRKQQEEELEVNRRLAEVEGKVEEKAEELQDVWPQIQLERGEITGLRRRIKNVEISLAEGQEQLKEANEKVQRLEEQLVTFIPPPDFTMTDFEQLKKGDDDWHSPPFYSHTGGYRMCLRVHAHGQGRGKGTHVLIAVHLMRGEHDDHLKWPFRGDITVSVLNQRMEEEHVAATVNLGDGCTSSDRVIGCELAVTGRGLSQFIAHSALGYNSAKNTQYLRNNCLKLRVTNVKLTNV